MVHSHRDLKPENFLLSTSAGDAALKGCDFGLSVFYQPGQVFHDIVGSAYYVAPEVSPPPPPLRQVSSAPVNLGVTVSDRRVVLHFEKGKYVHSIGEHSRAVMSLSTC